MLKNKLKAKAVSNATVTKGNKKNQEVLKEGSPVSISDKSKDAKFNTIIGLNKGITKNMENYESLRVDVWCSDTLNEGETFEEGIHRLNEVIDEALNELVEEYL